MQALLAPLPYELDPDSFLPVFHGFGSLLNNQSAPILKDNVSLHAPMSTATGHGMYPARIQGRYDLVNAVVDALHTPIEWHADLIF